MQIQMESALNQLGDQPKQNLEETKEQAPRVTLENVRVSTFTQPIRPGTAYGRSVKAKQFTSKPPGVSLLRNLTVNGATIPSGDS